MIHVESIYDQIIKDARELLTIFIENYWEEEDEELCNRLDNLLTQVDQ